MENSTNPPKKLVLVHDSDKKYTFNSFLTDIIGHGLSGMAQKHLNGMPLETQINAINSFKLIMSKGTPEEIATVQQIIENCKQR